jgi:hypothetical protein
MNWWIVLFSAVVILSIIRYATRPLAFRKKLTLIALRIIQALLIFIAFFEPVFHFQRISSDISNIPVLIDASQSMSLFEVDSAVTPFLNKLQQSNDFSDTKSKKYQLILFGDSVRKVTDFNKISFTDKRSVFPSAHDKMLNNSNVFFIISDANWSNTVPLDFFSNKTIYYLQLPELKRSPFLRILSSEFSPSKAGSASVLHLTIEGRIVEDKPITISVVEKNRLITEQVLNEAPGFFKRTLDLKIPTASPGKHLYRINAVHSDSLRSSASILRYVTPDKFLYQLSSSFPTLDRRFLSLSLSKHQEFKRNDNESREKDDCIFFFSWNDTSASALKKLKQQGIAVFIGCLPCSKHKTFTPAASDFITMVPGNTIFVNQDILQKLPPPSKIMVCPELSPYTPLLSLSIKGKITSDTVPLLFSTQWKGYHALVFGASNFWQLDFWPMSTEYSEEQAFSFSELFLTVVKEQLYSRISEQYFIYPSESTDESDSISFSVSFPSTIPVSGKTDIRFSIKDMAGKNVLDTTIETINTGSTKQKFTIRPIAGGKYIYSSSIHFNNKEYSFSDSLYIEKHNQELQVPGQNTLLLNEIGQPVSLKDITLLTEKLKKENSGADLFIEDSIQLNRNWWLLIMILAFLAIEWIYRRSAGLD